MMFFDVVIIPISDQIGIPIPVLMSTEQGNLLKGIDNKTVERQGCNRLHKTVFFRFHICSNFLYCKVWIKI